MKKVLQPRGLELLDLDVCRFYTLKKYTILAANNKSTDHLWTE